MRQVLILGGTGFVGRALCEQWSRERPALRLRVPTRRATHAQTVRFLPAVDVLPADVHDDATLARLVDGCDAVVNLVAMLHGDEAVFERAHVQLPRRLAAACRTAGVTRLVHVSALGIGPDAPSRYLRSKAAGEAAVGEGGVPYAILRPSVIFGAHDRFLNLFAALQARLPILPLAGATARFQPVWVADVARAITVLAARETVPPVVEAAGPAVSTLADLARLAGRLCGHPRPIWPLPDTLARLQAALLALLPGEPLLSADNLDSMRVPNVASGTLPGLAALGITPASVEAVAPTYLAPRRGRARLDLWRAHARR